MVAFKPHRDSRPMNERPIEIQMEAALHQSIKTFLSKKDQGRVMGAYREARELGKNPVANTKLLHENGNLDKVLVRGKFYGRVEDDGSVRVNWDGPTDYPENDSILWKVHTRDLEEFIALLNALKAQK